MISEVLQLRDEVHTTFSPALSAAWGTLSKPYGTYSNEPWLRGLQTRLEARYILVRDGDSPVGAGAVYLFRTAEEFSRIPAYYDVTRYNFKTLALPDAPVIPQALTLPLVILGPPVSGTHHPLILDPALSAERRRAVIAKLLDRIDAIAEEIGARLVDLALLNTQNAKEVLALRSDGVAGMNAAMMFLDLPPTFDEWLQLLSVKRRWSVKNEMRNLEAEGIRIELKRTRECPFLLPLYVASLSHHAEVYGEHLEEMARTTLAACEAASDESRIFVSTRGDQILGAAAAFRTGDLYQFKFGGQDPAAGKKAALYFNHLNAMIAEAIREGARRIDSGGGGHEAKLLRGFRAHPGFSVFLSRRDCPMRRHGGYLHAQNLRLLDGVRGDIERWGQFDGQAEADLGPSIDFARSLAS